MGTAFTWLRTTSAAAGASRGTRRHISNWERMWNQVVDDTAYDWVTFHTFRRSVATLIDREVGLEAAQAQLGHEDRDITRDYYVHKARSRSRDSARELKSQPRPLASAGARHHRASGRPPRASPRQPPSPRRLLPHCLRGR
ncbi:tyrosine-type recombinase/integrase [Nocardioides sp. B-3]|uniref:tyrosine-type recombinase/integrase n=1 Tax=Nocardioides sp. B-3 TaxID=2895565 RepID=UPI0021530347|nr:tyrosine-type recombinase/integrase [Nocardioides sp. B-3]UUZ59504.1 tyrosine-type recombinase/integrase [Nocardioides sp. B-3]